MKSAALTVVLCLSIAAGTTAPTAGAAQTLTVHATLSPDRLGAPTNLSATATFASPGLPLPPPVTNIDFYTPYGLGEDLRGTSTCSQAALEQLGTSGCPEESRAGFGGGMAVFQLGSEILHEPFTVDVFLASAQPNHLAFLIYILGAFPASIERVLSVHQIPTAKPYGLGLSVALPAIPTLPGASIAAIESAFFTFGSSNVAYYETVKGKRTLVHVKGLVAPRRCPAGGFPLRTTAQFADGSLATSDTTLPCPGS